MVGTFTYLFKGHSSAWDTQDFSIAGLKTLFHSGRVGLTKKEGSLGIGSALNKGIRY